VHDRKGCCGHWRMELIMKSKNHNFKGAVFIDESTFLLESIAY
jgi:hypothetical protein